MATKKLTEKEKLFVEYFVLHRNGAKAVRKAGYDVKDDVARNVAYELLAKPHIKAAIDERLANLKKEIQVDQNWVLRRLKALADGQITDVAKVDSQGVQHIDTDEMTWEEAYTITEVESHETITRDGDKVEVLNRKKKIKQADKLKALEQLCKFLGMEKLMIGGDPDNPLLTRDLSQMTQEELTKAIKDS